MAKALAPTGHQDAVISEAAPIHTMSMTMAPTTALPLAVEPEPATQSSGSGWRGRDFSGAPTVQALGGNRGPAIIIRGGPGGRDDDCDLRNALHPRGGGTAVNRLAPPLGGGYGRSGGGIR